MGLIRKTAGDGYSEVGNDGNWPSATGDNLSLAGNSRVQRRYRALSRYYPRNDRPQSMVITKVWNQLRHEGA